ncbi:hypothetical protein [Arsenophonus sp. PmNCSU2021_1]|uniref:hypothetical protein n=1 Tax=Arsenophonus sp. PmNCSU2021_1 TaxID=3118989 RepID=UPI002FF08101
MKFVRIKYREDNKNEDIIISLSKLRSIDKYYPNKLNPNPPFKISIDVSGNLRRISFDNKSDADNYFNYVMEKLRTVELKNKPW